MKDFIELLKLPPSILAAIAIGTSLILFLPNKTLQLLGLSDIPKEWRSILGAALIISTSLLAVYFIIKAMKSILSKYYRMRFRRLFPKIMKELRNEELAVVALLYRSPNYTSRLPYTDGVTIRLKSKNIIQLTATNSVAYGDNLMIPFTITPVAQNYIDKSKELIERFNDSELVNMYREYNDLYY